MTLAQDARRKRKFARHQTRKHNKKRHVQALVTVVVDSDHLKHKLRVRSRRLGLSGRQWKKLYKAVQRELKNQEEGRDSGQHQTKIAESASGVSLAHASDIPPAPGAHEAVREGAGFGAEQAT